MSLSHMILALALVAAPILACEENDCMEEKASAKFQCFSRGHCMDSDYLDAVLIDPEQENKARHCQELCMETPGCSHFTLELDSGICVLLEECGHFAYGKAVTGQPEPACPAPQCQVPGLRCLGTFLTSFAAESVSDCHQRCLDFSPDKDCEEGEMDVRVSHEQVRCGAFTFSEDSSLCTLTVGCDESAECEDCVGGHAACDVVPE